jgi:hypothetical protein
MYACQKLPLFFFFGIHYMVLGQEKTDVPLNPSKEENALYSETLLVPMQKSKEFESTLLEQVVFSNASEHLCEHASVTSGDKAKVYFMALYSEFIPHYKAFIDSNYCGPGCYYMTVDNQRTEASSDTTNDQLFGSFGTVVHETTHNFNQHTKLMVEPGIVVDFMRTETVYSENMASIVPADAAEKILRYKTYVGKGSRVGANQNGIYGLMDEFTAYRNGTKACTDAALAAKSKGNAMRTEGFLKLATQSYFAYYEFRLFIGWYMQFLEKSNPQAYTALLNNTNFRITYTLIEQGFLKDIQTMENLIRETPKVKWNYDYYEKEYAAYCKEHLPEVEVQLYVLRVEGVNKSNYRQLLKKVTYY